MQKKENWKLYGAYTIHIFFTDLALSYRPDNVCVLEFGKSVTMLESVCEHRITKAQLLSPSTKGHVTPCTVVSGVPLPILVHSTFELNACAFLLLLKDCHCDY